MSAPLDIAVFSHIAGRPGVSPSERLDEFVFEVRLAEELGFSYFFTTEHHFTGDFSLSPSQAVSLTVLARETTTMRFGPMVLVIPILDPLRVAEELLILDHLSKGRLEVGFGRGITPHEHLTYGVDPHTDRERLDEGVKFIFRAWEETGAFDWEGVHWQYPNVDIPWSPYQQPHPPVWFPTGSPDSAREYGRLGYGTGGFGMAGLEPFKATAAAYWEGCAENADPVAQPRLAYMAATLVAETDAEAERLARDHFLIQLGLFEEERRRSIQATTHMPDIQVLSQRSLGNMERKHDDLAGCQERFEFICGSPETVAEKLQIIAEASGFNTYIGEFSFGNLSFEEVQRSMSLFANEALPLVSTETVSVL